MITRRCSMPRHPAGITVLEVLIAIGIVAVGLTSVLSLIPLGRTLLTKAIVADQSGALLDNARATVITSGLANVEALTGTGGGPCPDSPLVLDPEGLASGAWPAACGLNPAVLRAGATLAADAAPESGQPRTWPVSAMSFISGDDVLMTAPDNDDLPVTNRFVNGVRRAAGRASWFAVLAKSSAAPFAAGEMATLSIVVCRNRVPGLMPPAAGVVAPPLTLHATPVRYSLSWAAAAQLFPDRQNREVVRKGAILLVPPSPASASPDQYRPPRFLTLSAVTFRPEAAGEQQAEIGFEGDPRLEDDPRFDGNSPQVFILPDATAVREYTTTIEGLNEFTR